jgi:preprotein translocase subunit SecE
VGSNPSWPAENAAKTMNATKEITAQPDAPGDSQPDGLSVQGRSGGVIEALPTRATLGLARWVQYVFVVVAAFLLWFLDKVATLVWQNFAEPPTALITALAAMISIGATISLYRNERVHDLVTDVVIELAKVTWPTRRETYASTIVVIVTSLIAAGVVGAFDFVWSFFTDLLYKHKV